MNILQKSARWAFEKAVGFPPWRSDSWPTSLHIGYGGVSNTGESVSADTALTISAVWACVRIRSQMMGHFPLLVYRKTPGVGQVELLPDHDLWPILHDSPNEYMTAMEWRQTMSMQFDLFGNAFSEITRVGDRIAGLNPLRSEFMSIKYGNSLFYEYSRGGVPRVYRPEDILHLRNFSYDGIVGLNPIEMQRNVLGLALAQQNYGAALHRNGGRPAGVLEHPAKLDKAAVTRLRESWESIHSGTNNGGRVAILWEGMKYNSVGMSPADQEFIASRQFQIEEIARIYGVQPHLIQDLDRSTNNNIEQQGIEAAVYGFAPTATLWEQRIKKSLLTRPGKDKDVYVKHNLSALMRGDAAARASFYSQMVQNGIMSRDECRALEELQQRGGAADELTVQSNMIELENLPDVVPPQLPGARVPAIDEPPPPALPAPTGEQKPPIVMNLTPGPITVNEMPRNGHRPKASKKTGTIRRNPDGSMSFEIHEVSDAD